MGSRRRPGITRWARRARLVLVATFVARATPAQITSIAAQAPTLSAVAAWRVQAPHTTMAAMANSISVLVASGGAQTIPGLVDDAVNDFPAPVRVTTEWQVTSLVSFVDLIGYFANPQAALSSGAADIPAAAVEGRMSSGRVNTFTPFTQGTVGGFGIAGGTLHLFRVLIVAPINGTRQRTDDLSLRLNLRGRAALPPGSYQGTLTLRATAY